MNLLRITKANLRPFDSRVHHVWLPAVDSSLHTRVKKPSTRDEAESGKRALVCFPSEYYARARLSSSKGWPSNLHLEGRRRAGGWRNCSVLCKEVRLIYRCVLNGCKDGDHFSVQISKLGGGGRHFSTRCCTFVAHEVTCSFASRVALTGGIFSSTQAIFQVLLRGGIPFMSHFMLSRYANTARSSFNIHYDCHRKTDIGAIFISPVYARLSKYMNGTY